MIHAEWIQWVREVGLGAFLALGVFGLCVWMVRFIITKLDTQMQKHTDALYKLENRISRSDERQSEAHRFQREEHQQMVSLLIKINGRGPERSER